MKVNQNSSKQNAIHIAPNPFNNELTISYEMENKVATMQIYNPIGEEIMSKIIVQSTTKIDLSNQTNGIYFIILTDGVNRISRKIIKN